LPSEAGDAAVLRLYVMCMAIADMSAVTNNDYKKAKGPSGLYAR